MLHCPFCGAAETDRFSIEGRSYLVFGCMFSPRVDPDLSDTEIEGRLRTVAESPARTHFRRTCDALHVYVTKGEGARYLTDATPSLPTSRDE